MQQAYAVLEELRDRFLRVSLSDTGNWTNQNLSFTRTLGDMMIYGKAILAAATAGKESRSSHYHPDYPDRNDEDWHKATIARYDPDAGRAVFEYKPVPCPLVEPCTRVESDADSKEPISAG